MVAVTVAWSRLHNKIALRSVGPAAEAAFPDKGPFGKGFVRGFMNRWRHVLTTRKPQALTETRASPDGFDKMMEWAERTEVEVVRKRLPAWATWNLDEVRVSFIQNKCTLLHVHEKGTFTADQLLIRENRGVGIVIIVSAV